MWLAQGGARREPRILDILDIPIQHHDARRVSRLSAKNQNMPMQYAIHSERDKMKDKARLCTRFHLPNLSSNAVLVRFRLYLHIIRTLPLFLLSQSTCYCEPIGSHRTHYLLYRLESIEVTTSQPVQAGVRQSTLDTVESVQVLVQGDLEDGSRSLTRGTASSKKEKRDHEGQLESLCSGLFCAWVLT